MNHKDLMELADEAKTLHACLKDYQDFANDYGATKAVVNLLPKLADAIEELVEASRTLCQVRFQSTRKHRHGWSEPVYHRCTALGPHDVHRDSYTGFTWTEES